MGRGGEGQWGRVGRGNGEAMGRGVGRRWRGELEAIATEGGISPRPCANARTHVQTHWQ